MSISKEKVEILIQESAREADPNDECSVQIMAVAELPSEFGSFQIVGLVSPCDEKEHTALVKGDIVGKDQVITRVHSECVTGDAMGSERCDCRDQLIASLNYIENQGEGVLLYLRQEGRNIGLTEKIRAYALQDQGYDTVEANIHLGHEPDERDYGIAANILKNLNVNSIRLLTNNPDKIRRLIAAGTKVVERVPLIVKPTEYNKEYLKTKAEKAGHLLGDMASEHDIDTILQTTGWR